MYPTCTFCGSQTADHYTKGLRGMICNDCIRRAGGSNPVPDQTTCALCGRMIGKRAGLLRRRTVVAVLVAGPAALCSECLPTLHEIEAESGAPKS